MNLIKKDLDINYNNESANATALAKTQPKATATTTIANSQKPSKVIFEVTRRGDNSKEVSSIFSNSSARKLEKMLFEGKEYSYCSKCNKWYRI